MPTPPALRRFFTAGVPENPHTTGWHSPAARRMFWTGLLVRVLYITLAHTYRFRTTEDHFPFGWEMGRIARALTTGRGFADPFGGNTGPTAWTPPLYPLLMAAYFKLFGVYSSLAAWFLLVTNSIFSAATSVAIVEIADRCYSPRPDGRGVAFWSGWLWALYPAALQYAVHWPWDMALTAWFFSMALVYGLRLRGIGTPTQTSESPTCLLSPVSCLVASGPPSASCGASSPFPTALSSPSSPSRSSGSSGPPATNSCRPSPPRCSEPPSSSPA